MTNKHTPTPWYINKHPQLSEFSVCAKSRGEGFSSSVLTCNQRDDVKPLSREEAQANAEFVVKACNSHDDLIEALFTALPFLEDMQSDPCYKPNVARNALYKIKAALEKSGEVCQQRI